MAELDIDPVEDARNEGWSFEGILLNIWEVFSEIIDDDEHISNPSNKGRAAVTFPVDTEDVPEGAVITSVTIKARVKRSSGGNYSATFNLVATDDTSKFTSRTLYPTTSFVDYTIGAYTRDPLGRTWDVETLNKLMAQVFSYSATSGVIQVARIWATVTYRVRPSVSISDPTGNLATASPTVTWTYSQSDGDVQASADYKIFTASDVASPSFNPDKSTPTYSGSVQGDLTSFVLPDTLATNSYQIYVRVWSGVGAVSQWANKSFSVEAPHPGVPTVTATGNSSDSKATLTIQDTSNLLSAVQADAESGDRDEYTATNCTFAKSSAQIFGTGTASYLMTSSGTSDMSITSDYFAIAPSKAVTLRAQALADTGVGRTNSLTLDFFDSDFASTGSAITGSSTDVDSDWTEIIVNGTTASTAMYAKLTYKITAPAGASEKHYVDHLGVMYGTDSSWTPGGHTSRNLFDSEVGGSPDDNTFSPSAGTTISTLTSESRTGASGTRAMNLTRVNPSTSISFVAAGTAYNSNSSSTSITLNKPAGLAAGDVMIAYITTDRLGSVVPPTGWDVIDVSQLNDSERDLSLHVLGRTAGGSEPASWTASMALAATRVSAQVVAYRGAEPVSSNFLTTGTSTVKTNSATSIQTAVLNNTTSNAWRLSAFASADDATTTWTAALYGTGGTTATIQSLGSGSSDWSGTSEGTSITIKKPNVGVTTNDIMISAVSWWEKAETPASFTPPAGWTVVSTRYSDTGYNGTDGLAAPADYQIALVTVVMWRKAGGSEPSTWTGSLSASRATRMSGTVAYRNVDGTTPFIAESDSGLSASSYDITTPTVNNTNSKARSVSIFVAHGHTEVAGTWTSTAGDSNKLFQYGIVKDEFIDNAQSMVVYDSGGIINTGNRSSAAKVPGWNAEVPRPIEGATAWIGILNPSTVPYVAGAAQTERVDTGTGTSSEYRNMSAYDSGAVISSGDASVLGTYGGGGIWCMVSWHGILLPASPTVDGLIEVETQDYIDISSVSSEVRRSSNNKMTLGAAFIGSTPGTPAMSLQFYRANRLLEAPIQEGASFDDSKWTYTAKTFDIPEGTTRVKASFSVDGRENGDTVDMDQLMLAFGSNVNVWKNGTTLGLHPIWNVPLIEHRDDDGTGFGEWQALGGVQFHPPVFDYLTGECTFDDHTIIPLTARQYRVRAYTHGLRGDGSAGTYGVASNTVNIAATYWWLKDLEFPENNMILPVKAEEITIATTNTATAFQPLGENYPIIITEGFKSDRIDLPLVAQNTDWITFRKLAKSGRSLFLQTDVNDGWWVRPISDIEHETLVSAQRTTDPYRTVKISFLQVAPEV